MRPSRQGVIARTRGAASASWVLGTLLLVMALTSATGISSCGSGGGSSNGDLCEQCGNDPDGPCQPTVLVVPGPDQPEPCKTSAPPDPAATPNCPVGLQCFRKLGSAQQRCFPQNDTQFRCDGARANRPTPTLSPTPTLTPTSTLSPTPTLTPTPTTTTPTPTATPPPI